MKAEHYGTGIAFFAAIFTGLNLAVAKIGVQTIPPFMFVAVTLISAGLILLAVTTLRGKIKDIIAVMRSHFAKIIWIAVVGTSVPFSVEFYALSITPLTNSFLLQIELLYSVLLGYLILGEKITSRQAILSIVAVIGAVLILTNGLLGIGGPGDILLALAPISFPAAHVVAKPILSKSDPLVITNLRILIGGCVLLIGGELLAPSQFVKSIAPSGMYLIAMESILVMMSNTLYYVSLKRINVSKAAAINQLFPVVSVPLGVLLFNEAVTPLFLVGGVMLMGSVSYLAKLKSELRTDRENASSHGEKIILK